MKLKKFYIIITGIITFILVSFFIGYQGATNGFTPGISENPNSIYFRELETEFSQLTQEQLANRKRFAEEVLGHLHSKIESDSLNPEETHEARLTIINILILTGN